MVYNIKNKGQISIEYIIFLAIFLLFFQAVIYPAINMSEDIIQDVSNITQSKKNITLLSENINYLANTPGYGKRTMFLYLPSSTKIMDCNEDGFLYSVNISQQKPQPNSYNCSRYDCNFFENVFIGSNTLDCDKLGYGYSGPLVIEKDVSGDLNIYAS